MCEENNMHGERRDDEQVFEQIDWETVAAMDPIDVAELLNKKDAEIVRLHGIYRSAIKGRADFRNTLEKERGKSLRLLKALTNFANPDFWIDEPGKLQWNGKRHAIEFAQSVIDAEN
jgi:3-methyladenine DNA glycosylase Tag